MSTKPNNKTSRHKLLITLEQFEYLQRVTSRYQAQAKRIEKNKAQKAAVQALADRFAVAPEEVGEDSKLAVATTRNDLRFLEKLLAQEHAATLTVVIPGYEERMQKDPERYTKYRDGAIAHSANLLILLNQVKERLA